MVVAGDSLSGEMLNLSLILGLTWSLTSSDERAVLQSDGMI